MARIWNDNITLRDFAARRLRRILPMLFATLLACIPFALWLMGRSAQIDFGKDMIASTLLVPNIFYSFQDSYWAAPSKLRPLLHLWTIGVEMQFYLLCPLIFLGLKKRGQTIAGLALISALSFAAALYLSRFHPDFAFYNLPTRLWEFGLGALVFYAPPIEKSQERVMTPIGLVLILGSFLFISESLPHPSVITLFPVIGTCFILAGNADRAQQNFLTLPFLRRIGIISFSAYLIHQPLFVFTRIATGQTELPTLTALGLILLTLILSEACYRAVETPLRKAGKLKSLFIAALGVAALGGGFASQHIGPQSYHNAEALSITPERWILNAADTRCVNKTIDHPCRLGNAGSDPAIALLGDSHMQAMAGGFDEFFASQNLNDIDYSMGGCPFIMGVTRYARKYPCNEFVENVFEQLEARQIKTVIILDRRNAYLLGKGAVYNDGRKEPADLRLYPVSLGPEEDVTARQAEIERLHLETIKRLRNMGIKVILIYPVPEIGIHVPDNILERLNTNELPLTLDSALHTARQAPLGKLKELAANEDNIITLNPAGIFCNETSCKTHSDKDIYYTDRDHLSRAGTELMLEEFGADILEAIVGSD